MGVAKCVCCCRRMSRTGTSNRWWDPRCGRGRLAWRCGCARRRTSRICWPVSACRWWRPASCRPECGYDRACGGDRRRRSDGADVGGRVGVGGARRRHRRAPRQSGPGFSISVESPIGSYRRGRWLRSRGSPGSLGNISFFPPRHNYGLGLWQNHIEGILAGWVGELGVPIYRGREVTGIAHDDTGVDVEVSDGRSLWAEYLVGCDGGRSLIRKAAGIEFPGWDPTTSCLIAEVEMGEEQEWGIRRDDKGIHGLSRTGDGGHGETLRHSFENAQRRERMGCYVLGFQEIDQTQVAVVGGKGAHLGELSQIEGLRVPAGFCVTTDAFQRIMAEAPSIDDRLDRLSHLKPDDREVIRALSAEIRRTLEGIAIPDDLAG